VRVAVFTFLVAFALMADVGADGGETLTPRWPFDLSVQVDRCSAGAPCVRNNADAGVVGLGRLQRPTNGAPFVRDANLDAAAIKALDEWNSWSVTLDQEFGGHLCRGGATIVASRPNVGSAETVTPSDCDAGTTPVGRYHTHGRYGNRGPSGPDLLNAELLLDLVFYVESPCNSIHAWQGLRSENKIATLRACQ
jgi:uncharacterized protein DUF4329